MKVSQGKILFTNKDLAKLFLPLIVEQALTYMVGLVDSIMVASVGEAAVSAVTLVDQVMQLLIYLFSAAATGGAVIAGQYLGSRKMEDARKASNQMVWFVGLCAVGVMAVVYLGRTFILGTVFGKIEPDVYSNANTYLMIVSASIPFLAIYNAGAAIFRTTGNSRLPMEIALLMDAINVIGNAVLIYIFHIGIAGVAIPTLVSRIAAAVLIIAMAMNPEFPLHIEKTLHHRFDGQMIRKITGIAVPFGVENSLFQLGKIAVMSLVSTFGTASIAANAVSNNVAALQVMPGMGVGLGMTAVISRCVGANDYEQAKYYHKKVLGIVYLSNFVSIGMMFLSTSGILHLYHLSQETSSLARILITAHSIAAALIWPAAFTQPITFRAAGDAKYPMIVNVLTMMLCRVVMAYLISAYLHWGVFGTYVAMFIDWIGKAIFYTYRYLSKKWMQYRII